MPSDYRDIIASKEWKAPACGFEPTVMPAPAAAPAVQAAGAAPGQVISAGSEGLVLASGDGWLRIGQLQRPGGRRLPVKAFLAGHPIAVGDRFLPGADEAG